MNDAVTMTWGELVVWLLLWVAGGIILGLVLGRAALKVSEWLQKWGIMLLLLTAALCGCKTEEPSTMPAPGFVPATNYVIVVSERPSQRRAREAAEAKAKESQVSTNDPGRPIR